MAVLPKIKVSGSRTLFTTLEFDMKRGRLETNSTSYEALENASIGIDFSNWKNPMDELHVKMQYIMLVQGGGSTGYVRVYRKNAGTKVSGTEVSTSSGSAVFLSSNWLDFSSESGDEIYQLQGKIGDSSYTLVVRSSFIALSAPKG